MKLRRAFLYILTALAVFSIGYQLGIFSGSSRSNAQRTRELADGTIKETLPGLMLSQFADTAKFGSAFDHFFNEQMRVERDKIFYTPFYILKDNLSEDERYYLIRAGSGMALLQDVLSGSLSIRELAVLSWLYVSVDFTYDGGFTEKKLNDAIASGKYDVGTPPDFTGQVVSSLTEGEIRELKARLPLVQL